MRNIFSGGTIENFKVLALASGIAPILFFVTFAFMPESPVYLTSKGNISGAKTSLQRFRGENYDVEDELIRIKENIKEANTQKGKISDLVHCKTTSKAMVISLGLMVFQQLSGINAVLFYAQQIFSDTGSSIPSSTSAILIGAVQVSFLK